MAKTVFYTTVEDQIREDGFDRRVNPEPGPVAE